MSETRRSSAAALLRAWLLYWLYVGRQLLDLLLDLLLRAWNRLRRSQRHLPPPASHLLRLSASRLAHKIRTRQVTAEAAVAACVARIVDVDGLLHGVAERRFAAALTEARAADAEIAQLHADLTAGDRGDADWALVTGLKTTRPLLGVPFVAHETAPARGMRVTGGLRRRRDRRAERDAAVVGALRAAGAVLVATTAGAEADCWWESSSALHGSVRLPHDLRRSAGGAAGGAAALVAAAAAPLAVAPDLGGALRTPAAFCGLFGVAASPELVSCAGIGLDPHLEEGLQAAGPLSRHAEDMATVLRVLARGPAAVARLREALHPSKLRVYCTLPPPLLRLSSSRRGVRDVLERATHVLRQRGASVDRLQLPEMADAVQMLRARLADARPDWSLLESVSAGGRRISPLWQLLRWPLGRSELTLPTIVQCLLPAAPDAALQQAQQLRRRLADLLDADGVLLCPVHPTPAPLLQQSYARPWNVLPALLASALGLPSCVVPCGAVDGLPVALQVVAAPGMDHLCLAALEVLQVCGGHAEPRWVQRPEPEPERGETTPVEPPDGGSETASEGSTDTDGGTETTATDEGRSDVPPE